MLHLVSFSRSRYARLYSFSCTVIACLLFINLSAGWASEKSNDGKNVINALSAHVSGNDLVLTLQGSTAPTYSVFELFKPARIVVDVANAVAPSHDTLVIPADLNITLATQLITDVQPNLTRFEFTLDKSYAFTAQETNKAIVLQIKNFREKVPAVSTKGSKITTTMPGQTMSPGNNKMAAMPSIESQLPTVDPMKAGAEKPAEATTSTMQDKFNFSGYNKEHITVDFYKIDLHNVFRLLRDVSGVNIVVDESVSGSLTLALNDVPWDFALDIILNLKNLAKEERFNTIVIHPKDKEFNWPQRAEDNLSFEADEEMAVQESLIIQQQENIPPNIVEAKKILAQGRKAEKGGNIEVAVQLYEKAFKKWPKNARLANKIASLYLVQLHQNAKAAYFADKALALDKRNSNAALNAAIANANMQENRVAQQYFDQSVSVGKPSKEAILSYAAFSEKQKNYAAAVNLLGKHDKVYGQNLASMIARARILDKMGKVDAATEAYKAILFAGFRVPGDLKKFIKNRIAIR